MNKSGIYPSGNRVLIKPDEIKEEVTPSGIVLPDQVKDRHELAQKTGTLVAVGPDAFAHSVEKRYGPDDRYLGRTEKGYSEAFADPGDRIAYARYAGQPFMGEDGNKYLLTNDEDITGKVSVGVELSDFESRKGLGQ